MSLRRCVWAALLAGSSHAAATAERPAPVEASAEEEIIVTGDRFGNSASDIAPEYRLRPEDLQAYAAANLAELLDALKPLTRSARGSGPPIMLLNGRRVASFSEIGAMPPEAIARVEIFSEEMALRHGFRPEQRVVNFLLRPGFGAATTQAEASSATGGGRGSYHSEFDMVRINAGGRWSLDARYQQLAPLKESERDIIQPEDSPLDAGRHRTLLPQSERFSAGGTFNGSIGGNVSATIQARLDAGSSLALLGLDSADASADPLTRKSGSIAGHLGVSINGGLAAWQWSATANYGRSRSETLTGAPRRDERAETTSDTANAEFVANGPVLELPAGALSASLKAGFERRVYSSHVRGSGLEQRADLSRRKPSLQASFDLPIASRARGVLGWLGNLSANLNGAVAHLSDFGTLRTIGYGINWSPSSKVRLSASFADDEGAPSIQQLGDPALLTPTVPLFDFARGETVLVEQLEGGNPALRVGNRKLRSVALTVRPVEAELTLSAEYTNTKIRNPITAFPAATVELEAAFPERFIRADQGQLVRIDARPVNFKRSAQEELRWGVNYSAGFGGKGPGAGRVQLALFHTWRLKDEVLVRDGLPKLDLLNGSASGSRGGRPRHILQLEAGLFKAGLGARLSANWQSGTFVRGTPGEHSGTRSDLFFSGLATVNLRLFADLGQQAMGPGEHHWLKGLRVTLAVDNLLDRRIHVRDAGGMTPLSYQPSYLDPVGRSIRISLRKQIAS
ncbi:MAG: TonB-dependent receptor [Pseudomonadota bacterium]|nr:TonB-dependent receptor [Pseudomonadota bacterium]